ncbi:stressosome-associated protein Prli42 [Paenibacillus medicaginis]|uniref:Stressosome-associated protein Prli42 n=1 Tax=Paenibacillus medicaginis TaxID=1470560 RepID=A0ABV5BW81_9BACL
MQHKKWFRIFIYIMLIAMIGSTLLFALEPLLYNQ